MKTVATLLASFGTAALLASATNAVAEDMLVGEYRIAKGAVATKQWISGAGEAIYAANYHLASTGRQPLKAPLRTQAVAGQDMARQCDRQTDGQFGGRHMPGEGEAQAERVCRGTGCADVEQ